MNSSIPAPGLLVEKVMSQSIRATMQAGTTVTRRLFPVDLRIANVAGSVADSEEWWRGALLIHDGAAGTLVVKNPFGQDDIPSDPKVPGT
jgi:hypothetical protein